MSHITSNIATEHATDIHTLYKRQPWRTVVPGWRKRKRIILGRGAERPVWYRL